MAGVVLFLGVGMAPGASVTVGWYPNGESNIIGYRIYVGTATRSYATPLLVTTNLDLGGTNVAFTITNLAVSGRYFVAVSAVNSFTNESLLSQEVVALTPVATPNGLRSVTNSLQGSASPGGPWTNVATYVTEVPDTPAMAFYRARVDWGK